MSRASMDGRLQRLRREAMADPREKIRAMAQAGEPLVGEPYAGLAEAALARALDTATPRSSAHAVNLHVQGWGLSGVANPERWGRESLAGHLLAAVLRGCHDEHATCHVCRGPEARGLERAAPLDRPRCPLCLRPALWGLEVFTRRVLVLVETAMQPSELLPCQDCAGDLLASRRSEGHEGPHVGRSWEWRTKVARAAFHDWKKAPAREPAGPVFDANASRLTLINWLALNDRNGSFRDEDALAEGMEPLTLWEAWDAVAEMVEVAREDNREA